VPWIVALTKPNHEAIAAVNLQRQEFDYYYPRYLLKKPRFKPVIRPLFPRYIFIHIEQLWRSLSGTRGISYLMMGENGPRIVQDQIINDLKLREDSSGLYQLIPPPKFQRGDTVKCEEGPFAGRLLLYEGMLTHERVACLLAIMGRKTLVSVEESALIAA
jgi:transcriptional antiterminator RfaH